MDKRERRIFNSRPLKKSSNKLINQSAFLERLAVLMQEGYAFYDGLVVLLPHHSKEFVRIIEQMDSALKKGDGVAEILKNLGFTPSLLLPIIVSEVDGRLPQALHGIAERMKRTEARRKKLRNILVYPLVLFIFMGGLLLAFRKYFLPNLQLLVSSRNADSTGIVNALPALVSKVPDILLGLCVISIITVIIGTVLYRKLPPSRKIRLFMSLPIVGPFFSKLKTRDFAGESGSLLHSGLAMQDALAVLESQEADPVISEIAKELKGYLIYGESFDNAIYLTNGLRKELSSYAKHGSDTGHLAKELMIYSESLQGMIEEETAKWLAILQPMLFSILALCILAAYLALLLPIYGMFDNL